MLHFTGAKGGTEDDTTPTSTPDTLRSKDTAEFILGLCEGPIGGPVSGLQSVYIGDTPIQNPDASNNFSHFQINFWTGEAPAAPVTPKLGGVSNNTAVGVTLFHETAVTREGTQTMIDHLEVRLIISQLFVQNDQGTFVNTAKFLLEYKALSDVLWAPVYAEDGGVISLTGKTTSTYVKEFRFAVNRIAEPYMIRVTKVSPENTTTDFCVISWESFQEVDAGPRSYDNTSILQIVGQASDQFTSIPDLWSLSKGFNKLKVPTNYDPIAKTYSGAWDGSFKLAWTDNPAWFLYNYVTNTQWGMSYYTVTNMDKFSVYDAAQWCDAQVDDGSGGTQARYTLNMVITDPLSGAEMARYIAGIFNAAYFDDQNGTAIIAVDKDDPATVIFAPENVVDGLFNYTYSDTTDRYNDLTVTFNNAELPRYGEDRRRVFDQSQIDLNSRVPLDFVAVGCTNEHEAIRRATYKLITATTEVTTVSFTTNRQGAFVSVFDVMLIADPAMGWGLSGRIQSLNGDRTVITLRDPVFLEVGVAYTAQFNLPNGVQQFNLVSPTAGMNSTITVDSPLPLTVPDRGLFDIGQLGAGIGTPKPFRVMSVSPVDGDTEQVTITGIEINRLKWAGADAATPVGTVQYGFVAGFGQCAPVTDIHVTSIVAPSVGGSQINILLDWTNSVDKLVVRNHVRYSRNGDAYLEAVATKDSSAILQDVPHGVYDIEVIAEKYGGTFSPPCVCSITITDSSSVQYTEVKNLKLVNGATSTTFAGTDAHFTWDMNTTIFDNAVAAGTVPVTEGFLDPTFLYYIANVYDPTTNTLIYTEHTARNAFQFTFEKNAHCTGGPFRSFRVEVGLEDRYGNQSPTFTPLTVSNPAPALLNDITVTGGFKTLFVDYSNPPETDAKGVQAWMSTVTGFTPDPTNLVWDGNIGAIILPVTTGGTYFVRIAAYDVFGKTGLNVSSELSIVPVSIAPVDIPVGSIDATKFAAGLSVPMIVAVLPTPPPTIVEGTLAFLTTDGNLYRWHSGAWTKAIPDGSVILTSFASSLKPVQVIANMTALLALATPSNGDTAVLTSTGKLYRYNAGAWTAAVDGADIVANSITTGSISTGAINAAQIAAGAVTASKLFIGDTTNLILDPTYLDQTGYWTINDAIGGVVAFGTGTTATTALNTPVVAQFNLASIPASNTNFFLLTTQQVKVDASKQYRFRMDAFASGSGVNKNLYIRVAFFDKTGASLPALLSSALSATGTPDYNPAAEFEYVFVTPATAATATVSFRVAGNLPSTSAGVGSWSMGSPRLERLTTGTLIQDGSISTNHITANAITTGMIQAAAIGANQIAANAISASKLFIGDTSSLILDPGFADPAYWTITDPAGVGGVCVYDSGVNPPLYLGEATAARFNLVGTTGSSNYVFSTPSLKVIQNTQYRFRMQAVTLNSANKNLRLQAVFQDSTGASLGAQNNLLAILPASYTPASIAAMGNADVIFTFVTPPNCATVLCRFYVTGNNPTATAGVGQWYVGSPRLEKMVVGTLIGDGEVTTDHIAANTITSVNIAAGTITGDRMFANTITAAQIQAGSITTTEIQAGTLTALNIQAGTLNGYLFSGTFFNGFSFTASTSVAASGSISFATQPTNGQVMTLNGTVFTFKTTAVNPTDIHIGTALSNTMTNMMGVLSGYTDAAATVPVTFTRTGAGPIVLGITYIAGGTGGNAYTLFSNAGTRSAATLTGGSNSSGYLEMDGRAIKTGSNLNGPSYRVVDDTGTTRVEMGRRNNAFGLWVNDSAGNLVFGEASLGTDVVQTINIKAGNVVTGHMNANTVTIPSSFLLSSNLGFTSSTSVWTSIWSTAISITVDSVVLVQTIFSLDNISTGVNYRIRVGSSVVGTFNGLCSFTITFPVGGSHTLTLEGQSPAGNSTMLAGSEATMLVCMR